MSTIMVFAMCSMSATAGYLLGANIRNSLFASQPWKFLRWDPNILGYRVTSGDDNFIPGDRIMMAVEVDTVTSEVIEEDYV